MNSSQPPSLESNLTQIRSLLTGKLPSSSLTQYGCEKVNVCEVFATPWTVAHRFPLSMGFSRQENGGWSGLPVPSLGDLPDPAIEPGLLHRRWILYHLSHPRVGDPGPVPDMGVTELRQLCLRWQCLCYSLHPRALCGARLRPDSS